MPEPKRIWNPPNPYLSEHRDLLGPAPAAELEVYEDESKSILSHNDSPDVGFSWSVNPYRGCFHACSYCLSGDTVIAMAAGGLKPLADIRVGDEVYGTVLHGKCRELVKTRVSAHWSTVKPAYRVTLKNGKELTSSGDHRFLTTEDWNYVASADEHGAGRSCLGSGTQLVGADHSGLNIDRQLRVVEVTPLHVDLPMFDITTGTGDFIANGVVSHNCYARPTHEYFGFGAGTDFERRIFVKKDAPKLLRAAFMKRGWKGERLMFSGVTDCYQPLEAAWKLTQGCLNVCLEFRNPVGIVTKSMLVRRDAELLAALAREAEAGVSLSIAFLSEDVARVMDPGAPTIRRRFETMEILAKAGVPVGIGVAPIIPGLNDSDIPGLLKEAKARGAQFAFKVLLRLPGSVKSVFFHRLQEQMPLRAAKIEHRIRETREGKLYNSQFGQRHSGEGKYWAAIEDIWNVWTNRLGFNQDDDEPERPPTFRRPAGPAEDQREFAW
jgi:DNA repair photolyase